MINLREFYKDVVLSSSMCHHLDKKREARQSADVPGGICTWNIGVELRIVCAAPITSVVCRLFTDADVTDKSVC